MPLRPGTRLGHYDVTAIIGEGGMGQGWPTVATQLDRPVALQIRRKAFTRRDPLR